MKKLIFCVIAATLVAQAWGMVSWMILPWHFVDFRSFKNDSNVAAALMAEQQGSGLYMLPNFDPAVHETEAAMAEWDKKAAKGPFAFISVRADGIDPSMGKMMAIGLLLNLVMAAILFWLLQNCSISSVMGRTGFVSVAGGVGAMFPHIANWNWWYFPTIYCGVGVIDQFILWGLVGFVMVKLSDWMDSKTAV